jgi:O-antigen ligase
MNIITKRYEELFIEKIAKSENILFACAIIILILIPIYVWFTPPFMILWALLWIIEKIKDKSKFKVENRYQKWLFILFLAFYFWQLIGITYSEDTQTGWNTLFSRLSLLFFPLVLLVPGEKIKNNRILLLKIFSLSTTIFIIICFLNAFNNSITFNLGSITFNPHPLKEDWMNYFYGYYFSINQHPSYLAMYVIVSIFISLESYFETSLKMWKRIVWLVIATFLLTSIYFLSSRSGLMTIVVFVPFYLLYKNYRSMKLGTGLLILLTLLLLFPIVLTNERVSISMKEISINSFFQKDERLSIWDSAINLISKNILLGVGIGDVKTELMKEYIERDDNSLIQNQYNVHNQYLEVLLENGIIGLILFLAILIVMLTSAISERNIIYLLFIVMMIIFFLFETVIHRIQGVTFFSLFSFLLLQYKGNMASALNETKNLKDVPLN